jgi:hypothetical protein
MLPFRGVIALANRTEAEILPAVDSGDLKWVFDVALKPEQSYRRELRFLAESVADFIEGRESALEWENVYRLLIPHSEPLLTSTEIAHSLNVGSDLPKMLAETGELRMRKPGHRGRPFQAALFSRESFENFLQARLVS